MLSGKGMYLWVISRTEGGNPAAIAEEAVKAGLSHVLIKIADGEYNYNIDKDTKFDRVPGVVNALQKRNIQAWGWHYLYGLNPEVEAMIAINRCQQLGIDGYVINAEVEYKNRHSQAARFMDVIKNVIKVPIALSSYRFPSYHPEFPWKEFLKDVDINMPQVYWMKATNPREQLQRCVREFSTSTYPMRPIIPTGAAFRQDGWQPTRGQVVEFMQAVDEMCLAGFNFWEWANTKGYVPEAWEAISNWKNDGYIPGPTSEPEEPGEETPIEETNKTYRVNTRLGLRLRSKPGITGNITGGLYYGAKVQAAGDSIEEDGYTWVKVEGYAALKNAKSIFMVEDT